MVAPDVDVGIHHGPPYYAILKSVKCTIFHLSWIEDGSIDTASMFQDDAIGILPWILICAVFIDRGAL